jgi:hypothetical protein
MNTSALLSLTALLALPPLAACSLLSPSAPSDLKFISVDTVDTTTLPAWEQADISKVHYNPLPRKVLEVRFSSNSNLVEDGKNWNNTNILTVACRDWKDRYKFIQGPSGGQIPAGPIGMETSTVYWNNIDVFDNFRSETLEGAKPFIYHYYIDIHKKSTYRPEASYDLNVNPQDVCFQITSAEMFRPGAHTNVIVIPKDAIAAALAAGK